MLIVPAFAVLIAVLFPHHPSVAAFIYTLLHRTNLVQISRGGQQFPEPPFTLFSTKVVLPEHVVKPAYIVIDSNGKIQDVHRSLLSALYYAKTQIVDVSPFVVMPGLIDPHVHVNEPGRTSWEGYHHASRAAVAGGTTTILDMPLNNIPSTVDHDSLAQKISALASAKPIVDVGIIGGVIPSNIPKIQQLLDGGVLALKSFMVDSQSRDFPNVSKKDLKSAVEELHRVTTDRSTRRIPYILHAELDLGDAEGVDKSSQMKEFNHESYEDFEAARPAAWEVEAVRYVAEAANHSKVHIHIAHVSAHEAVKLISNIRSSGNLKVATLTAETCSQYLLWAKEEIPKRSTLLKCSPPIRSVENRRQMLQSIFQTNHFFRGIDLIASDHSPCPPELKSPEGNMTSAWGGISGLQYRLQATWTAAKTVNGTVVQVAKLLSEEPARIFGIDNMKGSLKAGLDADIVIWDPDSSKILTEEDCHHRHKLSPFHGQMLNGVVMRTLLRGRSAYVADSNTHIGVSDQFGATTGLLLVRSPESGATVSLDPNMWHLWKNVTNS